MTGPAIAADFNQALNVERDVAAKVTLNLNVVLNVFTKFCYIFFGQILYTRVGIYTGCGNNVACRFSADTVDVCEADFDSLLSLGKSTPEIRAI